MSDFNETAIPTKNTLTCSHCGATVKEDSQFCSQCGQTITIAPEKTLCETCGLELNPDGICEHCNSVAQNSSSPTAETLYQPAESNKEASRKPTLAITLIAIGFLLILIVLGYFLGIPALRYHQAGSAMEQEDYYTAYTMYQQLDGYRNSENKINECIYRWTDCLLENDPSNSVVVFKNTVLLDSSHYSTIYLKIRTKIDSYPEINYWNQTPPANTVYNLLQMLPTSYENTADLLKLFNVLTRSGEDYISTDYVRENKPFLEKVWDIEFVQNYLISDPVISIFLEGYWTSGSGYYFKFFESEDGGTTSQNNLPAVAKPEGTKYFDIKDQTYIWTNDASKELAKVYKFTVNGFNSISIYCYENNATYKLSR